jgi:hypothetical protein
VVTSNARYQGINNLYHSTYLFQNKLDYSVTQKLHTCICIPRLPQITHFLPAVDPMFTIYKDKTPADLHITKTAPFYILRKNKKICYHRALFDTKSFHFHVTVMREWILQLTLLNKSCGIAIRFYEVNC